LEIEMRVELVDVDILSQHISETMEQRKKEVPKAEIDHQTNG
jgi:hypothetical protein